MLAGYEGIRTPNGSIVIVAPTDRQAGELFSKIRFFLLEGKFKEFIQSSTMREIVLSNGCRISAYPCGDDGANIRGITANVLILEEASFIKDSIVNQVLLPMIAATNGKIIKIGTPFGMNHFFHSFNDENYKRHHYTWRDAVRVGHFDEDYINEMRGGMSEIEFKTEYEAEFVPDEDAYFKYSVIQQCVSVGLIQRYEPMSDKHYFIGCDIARLGQDSTVITIVEEGTPHKVVGIIEQNKRTLDETMNTIAGLITKWNPQRVFIDETGLGAGIVDVLRREYNRIKISRPNQRPSINFSDVVVGITFTQKSKLDIYSNLRVLMERNQLLLPNNKKLIFQLRDFRYEVDAKGTSFKLHHSERGHDDYTDSLALAAYGINAGSKVIVSW